MISAKRPLLFLIRKKCNSSALRNDNSQDLKSVTNDIANHNIAVLFGV